MATKDFLPSKDAELLAWSTSFAQKITATPTAFGLVMSQATSYQTLHDAFDAALATSTDPATRTRGTISWKTDKRAAMKLMARELARIINAFPSITNQQRIDLGLNPRAGEISPIQPPQDPPVLEVLAAVGRTLKVRLHALGSDRRGKPDGCDGATVMSYIGSAPPADITEWVFQGSTTRTLFDVEFPPSVPAGAQVWLAAFWFNPRCQSGPACQPVSAYLAGGMTGSLPEAA